MRSDSDEGNPWPGFVDALSTTLLVFVFLVVVLVLVVTALAMQVGKKIEEMENQKAMQALSGQADLELTDEIEFVTNNGEYEKEIDNLVGKSSDATISIDFNDLGVILDNDTQTKLNQWLANNKDKQNTTNKTFYIIGLLSTPSVPNGTAYFVSYNRIMRIRKTMIDAGIAPEKIITRVNRSTTKKENRVIIRLK